MSPRVSQFPPPVGPRFVSGWARGMGVRKRWVLIDKMQQIGFILGPSMSRVRAQGRMEHISRHGFFYPPRPVFPLRLPPLRAIDHANSDRHGPAHGKPGHNSSRSL